MKPDKDRPSTWLRYRNGMCTGCSAGCCTMPVEVKVSDLVRLRLVDEDEAQGSKKKIFKRLRKLSILASFREGTDLFMLQSRPNGDCLFLNPTSRLCDKYEIRPEVCRQFPSIGPRPGYCPSLKIFESL